MFDFPPLYLTMPRVYCPFKVEPATSERSICKGCGQKIAKNDLILTIPTWRLSEEPRIAKNQGSYKEPRTQNIHMKCTALCGLGVGDFIAKSIEAPEDIVGWEKLTAEQKKETLCAIFTFAAVQLAPAV